MLKFQIWLDNFVRNTSRYCKEFAQDYSLISTSKYCKRFSQDYLQGKSIRILETNKYLVLKLFHKIFEFQMKRAELSKFQISFYDIS